MTKTANRVAFRDLDQLFRAGSFASSTDAELLDRFAGRAETAAFETLVTRHQAMVRRVCLDLLGSPSDAEDVSQATFVKLFRSARSIRSRDSLASWLHRVAVRSARRVRRESARRRCSEERSARLRAGLVATHHDPSTALDRDDQRRLLHEELDRLPERYRQPLILCGLEGLAQSEAACRLGWSEGSVRGRLARGKIRLRASLIGRGLAPVAVTLVIEEMTRTAMASTSALPLASIANLVGEAVLSPRPAPVASWFSAKAAALVMTLGATLALAAWTGPPSTAAPSPLPSSPAGALLAGQDQDASKPRVSFRVRVVDPQGKAVSGAKVYSIADPWVDPRLEGVAADGSITFERPESYFAGNFRVGTAYPGRTYAQVFATAPGFGMGWSVLEPTTKAGKDAMKPEYELTVRLVEDAVVVGRIVGPEGQAVANAIVSVAMVETPEKSSFAPFVDGVRKQDVSLYWSWQANDRWIGPHGLGVTKVIPTVTTGPDGRYRFTGVGRDRKVSFNVSGPGIGNRSWVSVTHDNLDEATQAIRKKYPRYPSTPGRAIGKMEQTVTPVPIYGASAEVDVDREGTIAGFVRDARSGRPVSGVQVHVATPSGLDVSQRTDEDGHYRAVRQDLDETVNVRVLAEEGKPYLGAGRVLTKIKGNGEATADFVLEPGVVVTGRVLEAGTGQPMPGRDSDDCPSGHLRAGFLYYYPLVGNPRAVGTELAEYYRSLSPRWGLGDLVGTIDKDGNFRVVVPPGPGVLLVDPYLALPSFWIFSPSTEATGYYLRHRYARILRRTPNDGAGPSEAGNEATLPGAVGPILLSKFIAYQVINPEPVAEVHNLAITIPKPITRRIRLISPTGEAVPRATVLGVVDTQYERPLTLEGSEIEFLGLDPIQPRECFALSANGHLTARFSIRGDSPDLVTITMEASTTLAGRLLDSMGRPIAKVDLAIKYDDERMNYGWPAVRTGQTDADGRFSIRGTFADFPFHVFTISSIEDPNHLRAEYHVEKLDKVTLKPREIRNLGDLPAIRTRN